MKMKSIIGFVLFAALLATGCSSAVETESDHGTTEPLVVTLSESNLVEMERVDWITVSVEAQHELEVRRNQEGAYLFTDNGKNYLAAFAGERNTGGYGVEIIEVVLVDSELIVSVEISEPGPDMVVTDALTYPMDLVELIKVESIEELAVTLELENSTVSTVDDERTDQGYYISPTSEYEVDEIITVGDIMEFDGSYIHIIAGDLVQVYEFDMNQASGFYLGQKVQLIKGESENTLQPFIVEDFSIRHSSMGQMIHVANGEITEISEETIMVATDNGDVSFKVYEKPTAIVGDQVEVHYMNFGGSDGNSVIALYRENSKMKMIVKEIHRMDNGEMMLYTSDIASEKIDYHVLIGGGTVAEFNYSEIQVGDPITVYADSILESEPAQVQARRVIK
jgi:hypothetical protein